MPKILFIENSGTEHPIEATNGSSVMQAALDNLVPGIVGDCGGCLSCATCHVYVDAQWTNRLSPPSSDETMMLEGVMSLQDNSRLTCQITVHPDLDGLVLRLPEQQF